MSKDKKDKKSKDGGALYQCEKCNGVSSKKGDVCHPEIADAAKLSKKERSRKPCKFRD